MNGKYIWITVSTNPSFKSIHVHQAEECNDENLMHSALWFKPAEIDEAKRLVKAIKSAICRNYNHKDRAQWLNEEWVANEDNFQ